MVLSFVCFLFWQQRAQSEQAKAAISRKCKQLDIQLLSVALKAHKLVTPEGKLKWHTRYQFEFSAQGDDYYKGELIMVGMHPVHFDIPPYRIS